MDAGYFYDVACKETYMLTLEGAAQQNLPLDTGTPLHPPTNL